MQSIVFSTVVCRRSSDAWCAHGKGFLLTHCEVLRRPLNAPENSLGDTPPLNKPLITGKRNLCHEFRNL